MLKSILKLTSIIIVLVFLNGCATNRGIVNLTIPEGVAPSSQNGKTIFVRDVIDNRTFEEAPKTPDVPSLGFGGAQNTSEILKKRAIARKRNGYGKALGDILLAEDQSVETVVRKALIKAFYELGYQLIMAPTEVTDSTIIIDTSIDKFWSWMTPGFWALTLTSEIETTLTISNSLNESKEIYVKSDGHFQIAGEKAWLKIMDQSLIKYTDEVKTHF